jgi:hypothetical protein
MVAPCTVVTCSADIATSATPTVAVDACERFPRRASWIAVPFTAASREANRGSGWVLDPIRIPRVRTNSARFKVRNRCGARWKFGNGRARWHERAVRRERRKVPLPPRIAAAAAPRRRGNDGSAVAAVSGTARRGCRDLVRFTREPRAALTAKRARSRVRPQIQRRSSSLRSSSARRRSAASARSCAVGRGVPSRSSQRTKRWS